MKIQTGANPPTPKACPNSTQHYLLTLAPADADLVLLVAIEVALWIA